MKKATGARRRVSSEAFLSFMQFISVFAGLTFTLRFYHDLIIPEAQRTPADEHVTSPDQLVRSIKYTPLQLDKESEEFIEKLRFLGEAFTFGSDQLALFLKTMYDTLGGAVQEDEEEGMEEYE
jgi:hypothetical protein